MAKYKYFIDLILTDTVLDGSEIEHFANIAIGWRQNPQWLDVSKYATGPRFSVLGEYNLSGRGVVYGGG